MCFEALFNLLEQKLNVKLKLLESNECKLYVFKYEDNVILIGCSKGYHTKWKYCKVVPSEKLGTGEWSCLNLEYNPWGYYCFGKDDNEIILKLFNKLSSILKRDG